MLVEFIGNFIAYGMMVLGWIIMAVVAFWIVVYLVKRFILGKI